MLNGECMQYTIQADIFKKNMNYGFQHEVTVDRLKPFVDRYNLNSLKYRLGIGKIYFWKDDNYNLIVSGSWEDLNSLSDFLKNQR